MASLFYIGLAVAFRYMSEVTLTWASCTDNINKGISILSGRSFYYRKYSKYKHQYVQSLYEKNRIKQIKVYVPNGNKLQILGKEIGYILKAK